MWWSKRRINDLDTCLAKMAQFYVHICTYRNTPLHFPLPYQVLSYHRLLRLLNVDCRWKGVKIEKFMSIISIGKQVGNTCTLYIYYNVHELIAEYIQINFFLRHCRKPRSTCTCTLVLHII